MLYSSVSLQDIINYLHRKLFLRYFPTLIHFSWMKMAKNVANLHKDGEPFMAECNSAHKLYEETL
jgi:hypothetical protein